MLSLPKMPPKWETICVSHGCSAYQTSRRQSLVEFFRDFERYSRDFAYARPEGYRVTRWTYRQLVESAAQFARHLESSRVQPGDRVLLWGPNSAEWAAAFWGCVLRGAVVVPMDFAATPDFAGRVAQQVQAKLVVATRERDALHPAIPVELFENPLANDSAVFERRPRRAIRLALAGSQERGRNCVYFGNHRRAKRRGHHSRQYPG